MRLPHPRLGRRAVAAVALVAVAAVAIAIVVISSSSGTGKSSSGVGSTATGATTVARRNLVETDTESGTLGYAESYTVYNRLNGTITWLPAVGQVIRAGEILFAIDSQPVILMYGGHPAYRALTASDGSGTDVYELNANLVRLGYDPDGIVVDDEWQAATTTGVQELQKALGEDETGSLALGDVVFLPGPQMISTLDGTVGSTGGGGGADASDVDPPSGTELVSLDRDDSGTTTPTTTGTTTGTTPTDTTTTPTTTTAPSASTTDKTLEQELRELRAEVTKLEAASKGNAGTTSTPDSSGANSGGDAGNNDSSTTAILQTTSTKLVVIIDLNPSLQSEATVGEKVTVEMPDGGTVAGRVTSVSPVASSSDDDDDDSGGSDNGSSTVPVTVTLDKRATGSGLDQAAVSVNFTQAKAYHVLTVPVTALLATGGDSFAVQEAAAPHKLIPVTTGLFAADYVEISGNGIYPGLKVTDSQG